MNKVQLPSPQQIDMKKHFSDCFGNYEKEVSARWIVKLMQRKGCWCGFTSEEINKFYEEKGFKDFWFNGLDDGEHIIENQGVYTPTILFIAKLPRREA